MTILAKVLHGSRLYGLDNSESDWDIKGIFLPSIPDCLLMRAARNINKKEEATENRAKTEYEIFSLQEFIKLAARGEDVAITMLHAPQRAVYESSEIFDYLRINRKKFYTKSMIGMVGFAKGMSAKYALRADRMDSVLKVISVLEDMKSRGVARLGQVWDGLPDIIHTRRFINERDRAEDKRIYEVVGKGLKPTITPDYALEILYQVRDSYGERVKGARNMAGNDLKAISHSFRVGYQLLHIYAEGDFTFPLPENDFIRAVKENRLNYVDDKIDEKLNELIAKVEELSKLSSFPEKVDEKWLDKIVLDAYKGEYEIGI